MSNGNGKVQRMQPCVPPPRDAYELIRRVQLAKMHIDDAAYFAVRAGLADANQIANALAVLASEWAQRARKGVPW